MRKALLDTVGADPALMVELEGLNRDLLALRVDLSGDATRSARNVFTVPSIAGRVNRIRSDVWDTTQAPTKTHQQAYTWAGEAFAEALAKLKNVAARLDTLETTLEASGGPWTPGRIPEWELE